MTIIDHYFKLQKEIFQYFDYVEDWAIIPLDDQTEKYWMICGPEDKNTTSIVYSNNPFTEQYLTKGKEIYSGTIYTQTHLPKWVYRSLEHTMISVDTHSDGNKLLMIFDNNKECLDEKMKKIFIEFWS